MPVHSQQRVGNNAHFRMDVTRCVLVLFVALSWTSDQGVCFPNGPPSSTCMTMFPKHRMDQTWKSSGPCPFNITFSSTSYTPSQNITITIEAGDKQPLAGLQISAFRKAVNREEFVGEFVSTFPANKFQYYNCLGGNHNQVTHQNREPTVTTVLVWQAPAENVGDVVFRATIVSNYRRFWALESAELPTADLATVVQPNPLIEEPTVDMTDIDFSGCGTDKGCFFFPKYCSGADCDVAMTYQKNGDLFTFEMQATVPGFVTVGLSEDTSMGQDFTITCTATASSGSVQNGLNPQYFNHRLISYNLTRLQVKKTESHVMCRFTRPRILETTVWKQGTDPPEVTTSSSDLEKKYYVMMARGEVCEGTEVMSKHTQIPAVSTSPINFQEYSIYRGSSMSRSHQAHGSVMAVAWVLFAGLATMIARHYKELLPGKTLLGTKVWFQLHRGVAVSAFLFTVAGFILIFVKLQKLSGESGLTHAIIGITVGVAVLLQVLAGMLRPGFDSKVRVVFNWGHWFMGQSTHILAAVNIMLAFNFEYTPDVMNRFGTIVVGVWIGVQVLWEIIFEIAACRKKNEGGAEITDVNGMTMVEKTTQTSSNNSLLFLYVLTLIGLTIAVLSAILLF